MSQMKTRTFPLVFLRQNLRLQLLLALLFSVQTSLGSIDEFMSCDRFLENKRSARVLEQIPCDMTKTSYCAHKGASYPEAAIWRFKEENRALMKRLYGDLESNSVYREMRAANLHNLPSEEHSVFSSAEYNIRMGSGLAGLATVKSAREPVVDVLVQKVIVKKKRKHQSVSSEDLSSQTSTLPTPDSHNATSTTVATTTTTSTTTTATTSTVNVTEPQPLAPVSTTTTPEITVTSTEITQTPSSTPPGVTLTSTEVILTSTENSTTSAGVNLTSLAEAAVSLASTEGLLETFLNESSSDLDEMTATETDVFLTSIFEQPVTEQPNSKVSSEGPSSPATAHHDLPGSLDLEQEVKVGEIPVDTAISDADLHSLEQIVGEMRLPQKQNTATDNPDNSKQGSPEAATVVTSASDPAAVDKEEIANTQEAVPEEDFEEEEIAFDDDEDDDDEVDYSGPSINACPVKEEVFAPYWANNTRDQVMALLNLYPFEQYIHMETCKFPDEEMMCRKGCKCEQQYRLHRLLAFDPNNECRGIFSDWFRFPSYCVCKCYNFPEDFVPRRRRKPKKSGRAEDPQPRETKNISLSKEEVEEKDEKKPGIVQNIPAFLPYEAKQALLRDMDRNHRTLEDGAAKSKETSQGDKQKETIPTELNVVEKHLENGRLERKVDSADHFLYGNTPVVEYQLSDGTGGTVRKTPRK